MPNSNLHCEDCPFDKVDPAGVGIAANFEYDLVMKHLPQNPDPNFFDKAQETEVRATGFGIEPARLFAARGCAAAIRSGVCKEWALDSNGAINKPTLANRNLIK